MASQSAVRHPRSSKRPLDPRDGICPASFPRTGRTAEQLISDEERRGLEELRRSLNFANEEPAPPVIPSISVPNSNPGVEELREQLATFQAMRKHAEDLAQTLNDPKDEVGSEQEKIAQLLSKKEDLENLQKQLAFLQQMQQQFSAGFDDEDNLEQPTIDSPREGPPDYPPPAPPAATSGEMLEAEQRLQELESKKQRLEQLRGQLESLQELAKAQNSTSDRKEESAPVQSQQQGEQRQLYSELQNKTNALENLKNQLSSLRGSSDGDGLAGLMQKKAMLEQMRNQLSQFNTASAADDVHVPDDEVHAAAMLADLQRKKTALEQMKKQLDALKSASNQPEICDIDEVTAQEQSVPQDQELEDAADVSYDELEEKRSVLLGLQEQLATLKANARPVAVSEADDVDAKEAALADLAQKKATLQALQQQLQALRESAVVQHLESDVSDAEDDESDSAIGKLQMMRTALLQKKKSLERLKQAQEKISSPAVNSAPNTEKVQTALSRVRQVMMENDMDDTSPGEVDKLQSQYHRLESLRQQLAQLSSGVAHVIDAKSESAASVEGDSDSVADGIDDNESLMRDEATLTKLLEERAMLQKMIRSMPDDPDGLDIENGADATEEAAVEAMEAELAELKQARSALEAMKNELIERRDAAWANEPENEVDDQQEQVDVHQVTAPAELVRQRLASLRALAPLSQAFSDIMSQASTHGTMRDPDEPIEEVAAEPSDQLLPKLQNMMEEMRNQQILATKNAKSKPTRLSDVDNVSLRRAYSVASSIQKSDLGSASVARAYSVEDPVDAATAAAEKLDELVDLTSPRLESTEPRGDDGVSVAREDGSVLSKSSRATGGGRKIRSVGFSDGSSRMDELSASNVKIWEQLNDLRKEVGMLTEFIKREPEDNIAAAFRSSKTEDYMLSDAVETNRDLHVTIPRYTRLKAEVDAASNVRAFSQAGDSIESDLDQTGLRHGSSLSPHSAKGLFSAAGKDDSNLKLASLFAESLPLDRRASFLRSFVTFHSNKNTAERAFQLSVEKYMNLENGDEYDKEPDEFDDFGINDDVSTYVSAMDFDSMKDGIYREVANFIALNEARPNFLVSFFQITQQLDTDLLRDQALTSLQDLLASSSPQKRRNTFDVDNSDGRSYLKRDISRYDGFGDLLDEFPEYDRPSSEHRDRSYDYEETAQSATDVPTPPGSDADENDEDDDFGAHEDGTEQVLENEGLAMEFQNEIEGNKEVVLKLSQHLDDLADGIFTAELVDELTGVVVDLIGQSSQATGSGPNTEVLSQLSKAVRKVLLRNVGKSIEGCSDDLLRSVSDILYDVMIFNKVIQQVDKSYTEEISELQSTQDVLDSEVHNLQHQRDEDLARLMNEQLDRLGKMKWGVNDDDGYDDDRDDELANQFDVGKDDQDSTTQSIVVELTPSEARIPGDPDEEITLDDLPDRLTIPGSAKQSESKKSPIKANSRKKKHTKDDSQSSAALRYLDSFPLEDSLVGDDSAPLPPETTPSNL